MTRSGDHVLRYIAQTFVANSRQFDLYGRWGGEEFLGIIRNINTEDLVRFSRDELEQKVVDRTRDLEKAHQQLVLKEKLAVIGQLAGGVVHDIRNPLGSISNSIYFLNQTLDSTIDEKLKNIY